MEQAMLNVMPNEMQIDLVRFSGLPTIVAEIPFENAVAIFANFRHTTVLNWLKLLYFLVFKRAQLLIGHDTFGAVEIIHVEFYWNNR